MKKLNLKICLSAFLLFFLGGIMSFAQTNADKTIVLLSDAASGNDQAQYDWLMANGFNVTSLDIGASIDMTAPSQDVIDQMNAADLVIVGRDANSSSYDGAGQDVIDNITAPVITVNPFGAQWGVPQLWFTNGVNMVAEGTRVWIHVDVADPIFANSNVQGDSIPYSVGALGTIVTPDAHNGSVVGSIAGDQMAIVRFAANVSYNTDAGSKTPKSDRTIFSFQNGENSFSLTMEGQAAYYGEIRSMLGLPIEAPMAYAGNPNDRSIVLLSDAEAGNDQAQYEWLMANGFNVTRLDIGTEIDMTQPSQDVIDQMNAADLVIVGRDVNSSKYDGAGQDVIDNITAPVMTVNPFGAQWGVPQLWFTNGVNLVAEGKRVWIQVDNTDPIFANSNVQGDSISFSIGALGTIQTSDAHNGSVVGSVMGDQMAIVRFTKDVPYNADAGSKTPKSDRTIFSFQNGENSFSLTNDGQAAYFAEICSMTGLPIQEPKVYAGYPSTRSIVLLSDAEAGNDQAQYEWLMANGFNVTRLELGTEIDLTLPSQEVIDQMNEADLVIVGRDVNSSKYDGDGQDVIDNITAPVLTANPFGAQWGVPQLWFTNGVNLVAEGSEIWIQVAEDPIFAHSEVDGDSILFCTGALGTIQTPDAHNGSVIGSVMGDQMAIVRFDANVPYNTDAASKTPKSDRSIFSFQNGPNSFNLSEAGQAAYFGEISRMMELPINAPSVYFYDNAAASIVLLTDAASGGDFAQYTWLLDNGFSVTSFDIAADIDMTAPSQETIDMLNAASLVIMGRDANSSSYDGAGQDVVDNITAPVITANPFGAQWGVPQLWFTNGVNLVAEGEEIWIQVSDDPIFANSNVDRDSILYCTGALGTIQTPDAHNGSAVGSVMGDQMAIVRFDANVPYNTDAASKTPKSDRTIFSFMTGVKSFNLTEDGQAAYYGEIRRLLGYSIEAPVSYYVNPSSVSTLSGITTSLGSLDPSFGPDVTFYTLEVPAGTASLDLTATATDANAIVDGAGTVSSIPSTVTITVTAENGVSTTDYVVEITLEGTGINDFKSAGIRMYPNPASQSITVDGLVSGSNVSVLSVSGQLFLNTVANANQVNIDLGQLSSGVYLIKVELAEESYFSRFIKH